MILQQPLDKKIHQNPQQNFEHEPEPLMPLLDELTVAIDKDKLYRQWPVLNELKKLHKLPLQFDDSSCQVWLLDCLKDGQTLQLALKSFDNQICSAKKQGAEPSFGLDFWSVMQQLFDCDLSLQFRQAAVYYPLLKQWLADSGLQLPECLGHFNQQAESAKDHDNKQAAKTDLLLLSFMEGQAIEKFQPPMIETLAKYFALLHQQVLPEPGLLAEQADNQGVINPMSTTNWQMRLLKLFYQMPPPIGENELQNLLQQVQTIPLTRCVPSMIDLRADQLAQTAGQLSGLFDLDAFVSVPIEMDFVLLEYLLSNGQLNQFEQAYLAAGGQSIDGVSEVREVYRTVFYLMNALGETDYQKWMAQPDYFV